MSEAVVLSERRGAVVILTINRPKALNALNDAVLTELQVHVDALMNDTACRAVVLRGAGDKSFVAGADIAFMQNLKPTEAEAFAGKGQKLAADLAALPQPVVVSVQGYALGGGCEMAMAGDIIIAGPKAVFGQPEVKLGVIPGFGGTQRLVRRVGTARALDLCLTGRMVKSEEALTMGLVSRTADDAFAEALSTAETIAGMGPVAVRLCKRAIHENADVSLEAGLAAERTLFALCFSTDDQSEGMSAFLERRSANFQGC